MPSLGKRLRALRDSVTEPYDEIWDLCCDHGFLGMALLDRGKAKKLYFVDQLPGITADLAKSLQAYPPEQYRIHTLPAEQVRWQIEGKRLVIIAGVGGETVVDILQQLIASNNCSDTTFLLSPANSWYELRAYLSQQDFGLKAESVVFERRRAYELLLVSVGDETIPKVDCIGRMWRLDNEAHYEHLQALLIHYQRRLRNIAQQSCAEPIVAAYEQLLAGGEPG